MSLMVSRDLFIANDCVPWIIIIEKRAATAIVKQIIAK